MPQPFVASGWMYVNEVGQMCGPYIQEQLYEGLSSGFLPDELPVYPMVNGTLIAPVPLKYFKQFPDHVATGFAYLSIGISTAASTPTPTPTDSFASSHGGDLPIRDTPAPGPTPSPAPDVYPGSQFNSAFHANSNQPISLVLIVGSFVRVEKLSICVLLINVLLVSFSPLLLCMYAAK